MKSKPCSDCWPSLMFSQEEQEKVGKYGIFSTPIDCGLCDFEKNDSSSPLLEKKKNVRRKALNAFINNSRNSKGHFLINANRTVRRKVNSASSLSEHFCLWYT